MVVSRTKRIASFFLIALFMAYYSYSVLFTHQHYVDGVWLTHTHATTDKSHTHSSSEDFLLTIYSAFSALQPDCAWELLPCYFALDVKPGLPCFGVTEKHLVTTSLRAPPAPLFVA